MFMIIPLSVSNTGINIVVNPVPHEINPVTYVTGSAKTLHVSH